MNLKAVLILVGMFFISEVSACTGIYLYRDQIALFGSNEDYNLMYNAIFVPANPGKYGAVFFSWSEYYMQGGVNEVGLCYDGFATGHKPINNIQGKINPPRGNGYTDPMQYIIRNYETVPEALEEIKTWDLNSIGLDRAQLMIADRFGNSATIEGDSIIYIEGETLVTTNFYRSDYPNGNYPCSRYKAANRMLNSTNTADVELFKDVLNAVHQEGQYYTVYSYIADLSNGMIYIYNNYNYEEVYSFNLSEELKKGYREIKMPSFFSRLNLSFPANEAKIDSNAVNIRWTGNAKSYKLLVSKTQDFSETIVINIPDTSVNNAGFNTLICTILSLTLLTAIWRRKSSYGVIVILLTCLIFSCTQDGTQINEPEQVQVGNDYTISLLSDGAIVSIYKLEPGQEYFWKVECTSSEGFITNSEIRKFIVNN